MRVLFVCTTGGQGRRQLGGAERFLMEMLPALAAEGVEVYAATPDDEVAESIRDHGLPWTELGATSRVDLGYVREIHRLVRHLRPDVVSAHLLSAAMHARAALSGGAGRRVPLVVALHNSLWQYLDTAAAVGQRTTAGVNIAVDLSLRRLRPHSTVAVSQFEADELRARGRVTNVHVIPNPLPADWPDAGIRARGGSRPARVGFLGRLEREKGADLLGEVATLLPELEFAVAGTGSVPVPGLPNMAQLGRVNSMEFLRGLDCLLVPSRVEAFGRSALEAMSLGVPVVHTGTGGLADLAARAEGILGFRAELQPASMAAAIGQATGRVGDHDARLELARWYREEFAFPECVRRWRNLYERVVHDGR